MYVCMHACMCVFCKGVKVYASPSMYTCAHTLYIYIYIYMSIYIYIYTHIYICIYVCICSMCKCKHVFAHIGIRVCLHACIPYPSPNHILMLSLHACQIVALMIARNTDQVLASVSPAEKAACVHRCKCCVNSLYMQLYTSGPLCVTLWRLSSWFSAPPATGCH